MKSLLVVVTVFVGLVGCTPKSYETEVNVDDIDPTAEINEMLKSSNALLYVCKKTDEEQGVGTDHQEKALQQAIQRELVDEDHVTCDGTTSRKRIAPAVYWHQFIDVPREIDFKTPVNFITVKNLRTCVEVQFDTSTAPAMSAYLTLGGNRFEHKFPFASPDGAIRLYATDSKIKIAELAMGFAVGNNLLEIEYFGACDVYKPQAEQNAKLGDSHNCAKAKSLYVKKQLVVVAASEIVRPEVKQVDICKKDKLKADEGR